LNPGRRDGKPATNRLSYGAAYADTKVRILRFLWFHRYMPSPINSPHRKKKYL
jgi:hypothetical protein